MAKVRSERDLVDHGIRALVDALGYGGAARFLRHILAKFGTTVPPDCRASAQ